jgi:hypothetical protein
MTQTMATIQRKSGDRTTEASVRSFWHAYRPLMGF